MAEGLKFVENSIYVIDHVTNSNLGPLFWNSMYDQFTNIRDGDRFWYENDQFSDTDLATIYSTTLKTIITRNTNITNIPDNVFFIQERQLNATSILVLLRNTDYIRSKYIVWNKSTLHQFC